MKTPKHTQVNTMPAAQFFGYAAELMKLHPPHITDWGMLARLKRIGFEPGKSFDLQKASPAVRVGLERAVVDGLKLIHKYTPMLGRVANGWIMMTDKVGAYGATTTSSVPSSR